MKTANCFNGSALFFNDNRPPKFNHFKTPRSNVLRAVSGLAPDVAWVDELPLLMPAAPRLP
jgi:hypothetical protein